MWGIEPFASLEEHAQLAMRRGESCVSKLCSREPQAASILVWAVYRVCVKLVVRLLLVGYYRTILDTGTGYSCTVI